MFFHKYHYRPHQVTNMIDDFEKFLAAKTIIPCVPTNAPKTYTAKIKEER